MTEEITLAESKIDEIQKQTDISLSTNKLLDLRIEEERHVTAQILKQFLDDYLKATKPTHWSFDAFLQKHFPAGSGKRSSC